MRPQPRTEAALARAEAYAQLLDRFSDWAAAQPDLRAAAILGSRARTDHPADEWSDLDIVLFTMQPGRYTENADWVSSLGKPVLTFVERTPGDGWERRVLFADGLDVDLAINPAQGLEHLATQPIPADMADVLRRGIRVLVDKDGHLAQVSRQPLPQRPQSQRPDEARFLNNVHDFWYHTLWSARHLRRGELWWAKSGLDMHLKWLLMEMLEWHAHATRGPEFDTWLRGRFLEEWADPRAVAALPATFAHYDAADCVPALRATMDLFRWVARETAARWGYAYPSAGDEAATQMTEQVLRGQEAVPAI